MTLPLTFINLKRKLKHKLPEEKKYQKEGIHEIENESQTKSAKSKTGYIKR